MWKPRIAAGLVWATALVLVAMDSAAAVRVDRGEYHFLHAPVPEWVESVDVASTWPHDAPGATGAIWRNWLIDTQVDRRGAVPTRYFDSAIEATTQGTVDAAARFNIGFRPEFETLAIHRVEVRRDGAWSDRYDPERITLARREAEFESGMATGTVSALIVVDDVRPGDVVRYSYSIKGENPILADMTHDEFPLAWIDPILTRNVRVEYPPQVELEAEVLGGGNAPTILRTARGTTVRHRGEALAGIPPEEDTPGWHAAHPVLQVARRREWADVATWAATLYPPGQALPAELESMLDTWRALPTEEARVEAALQRVQDDVRYFSVLLGESTHRPAAPAITWERRFGDCKDKAWLLQTLLQRLGIEAVPAMTSVQSMRGVQSGVPAASRFDHVIVRARVGGRELWLDPTLTGQRGPLALRQAPDYGAALPVVARANLQTLGHQRLTPSVSRVEDRFEPVADGSSVRLSVVTVHQGVSAEHQRRRLEEDGLDRVGRAFADYYRRVHGEIEVAAPLQIQDDPATGTLTLRESYLLLNPWASQAPGVRSLDLQAESLAGVLQLSGTIERRHPLQRAHPLMLEHVTELVLPEGWKPINTPAPVETIDASFRYRRDVSQSADQVKLTQHYESLQDHVAPPQLARHFENRRIAADALGMRLSFSLPGDATRSERARRLRGLLRDMMDEKEKPRARR